MLFSGNGPCLQKERPVPQLKWPVLQKGEPCSLVETAHASEGEPCSFVETAHAFHSTGMLRKNTHQTD